MNKTRTSITLAAPEPAAPSEGDLEFAADQAIATCRGDAREAVKALLVANGFLEAELEALQASVSTGYARGRFDRSRDRKE
ncbi:hypothetical protein [Bradyrhizobium diazoefficiens]|uniref:hypothetical protein n=1 Tax=Bradyrhizobium diazoefficiens TaxID=1355477 RepID=UPI001B458EF8|nr:hypothetical protein [Bradyrhizobium japonicum]